MDDVKNPDLDRLIRQLAMLSVICPAHRNHRAPSLADAARNSRAFAGRAPGIQDACSALAAAQDDYEQAAPPGSTARDDELEEAAWAAVAQAASGMITVLRRLPGARPDVLQGLPEHCCFHDTSQEEDPADEH